jgi:hypothetical protein
MFNTMADPTEEHHPDDEQLMKEDYFAADGEGGQVIDANDPIWDARTYWLSVTNIRVRRVLREWKWLFGNIEAGVTAWVSAILAEISVPAHMCRKSNIQFFAPRYHETDNALTWNDCSIGLSRQCSYSGSYVSDMKERLKLGPGFSPPMAICATSQIYTRTGDQS